MLTVAHVITPTLTPGAHTHTHLNTPCMHTLTAHPCTCNYVSHAHRCIHTLELLHIHSQVFTSLIERTLGLLASLEKKKNPLVSKKGEKKQENICLSPETGYEPGPGPS